MLPFVALCLSTATLVASVEVTCKTDIFQKSGIPNMKLVPKDFNKLSEEISTASPLILFIRSAEAMHDTDEYRDELKSRLKSTLESDDINLSQWTMEKRPLYFDPDLSSDGHLQVQILKENLEKSGWAGFLKSINDVIYLTSPQSRTIETAVASMPKAQFIIDDGVRTRFTPLGPDQRRSFKTPLKFGGETFESLQEKFVMFKDNLIFKMANLNSYTVSDRFGFYSDDDPCLSDPKLESEGQLRARILQWINMLNPASAKAGTAAQKVMDTVLPEAIHSKITSPHPKVYVVYSNSQFINGVIDYFDLKAYKDQDYSAEFCEVVPILLQFQNDHGSTTTTTML